MSESLFQIHKYRRYYQNLEPMFKTQRAQAYLMVTLSLLAMSFFGFFAIRPTLKTIATLQRRIDDSSSVNAQLEGKINQLIAAQEEYQRVEPNLPLIYSLLPEKAELPSLLRKIENLALANEATISSLQFDPIILYPETAAAPAETSNQVTAPTGANPLFFSLSFVGLYPNLVKLLEHIIALDRLLTIDSVSLTLTEDDSQTATLNVAIASQAYYYQLTL